MKHSLRQKLYTLILLSTTFLWGCGSSSEVQVSPALEGSPEELLSDQEAYIMVHHEVYEEAEYPAQWSYLESLVELSDTYNVKLTLSFSPGWGEFLLANPEHLEQLRVWESEGYEIAAHHHGVTHGEWDGYTSLNGKKRDPRYKGSIEDMMDILSQLPVSGEVLSASMSDAETDWPEGVYVMSAGDMQDKVDNVSSEPVTAVYNGVELTEYSKAGYFTGKAVDVGLDTFLSEIDTAPKGEVIGVALSDDNFSTQGVFDEIEALYLEFEHRGISVVSLSEIHNK